MIAEIEGDIFKTDPRTRIIVHQANCFNTLADGTASGIAGIIGKLYPEAKAADAKTEKGDKRPTNYNALVEGLEWIKARLEHSMATRAGFNFTLAIPYGLGCVRGGGSWQIVEAIIMSVFTDAAFDVEIIRLPGQENLK